MSNSGNPILYSETGAFSKIDTTVTQATLTQNAVSSTRLTSFNASNSNSVYTNSGKVYPLSLALNFIIKC